MHVIRRTQLVVVAALLFGGSTLWSQTSASEGKTGTAAFYSHRFERHRTSDHGVFHSNRMTAASATLPLGAKVRITNLKNGRSVIVRITDRYADKNRLIDVSKAVARKLHFVKAGTAQVKVELV